MSDEISPQATTQQSETAAGAGAPAAASSPGSSTSDPFVGDPGPGFDPAAPAGPQLEEETPGLLPEPVVQVGEEQIRDALLTVGDGVHAVLGVGDWDWVFVERDLERIAPPLTRIVNRYEPLARAAGHSDALAVAIGSALYAWRSMLERQAVLEARAKTAPQRAAEPGPGASGAPDPSAGYQTFAERLAATRPEETETP